ncbi:MAG: LD-carboxypeptidase [Actinobacteria bacterium]|nr:MAG: LD-carboxypeptidase [Actinomycetota bacterium]
MRRATVFGRPLPDGGTIGVAATSSPYFNKSEVLRGVEWWESMGYRVKLGESVWERDDYMAGSPEVRARDVTAMFADSEVDVVQCLQGGFGAMETLPLIDYDVVAEHPKPFCGYSDVTALHTAFLLRAGLATFYSNGLMGMGWEKTPQFNKDRLLKILRGETTGQIPRDPEDPYSRTLVGGKVTAPLVGGNLSLLVRSVGTRFEFDVDGCIFIFENVHTPPWELDADLIQLRMAGKLDHLAGVIVGDMEHSDWSEERPEWPRTKSLEDVLEKHLMALGVPVLYKLPLGHGKHLAALPLGVDATLDADAKTLTIDQPALLPAT